MKRNIVFILWIVLIMCFNNAKASPIIKQQKKSALPGYKMIYTLKDKQGAELGKIYVKEIKPGIFRHLRVIKEAKQTDTLYYVDDFKLRNPKGMDIEAGKSKEFWGCKLVADGDRFTITMIDRKGHVMSDDLDIIWDKKSKVYKIFKT